MFLLSNHAHLVVTEIELNLFPPLVLLCGTPHQHRSDAWSHGAMCRSKNRYVSFVRSPARLKQTSKMAECEEDQMRQVI